MKASGNFFNDLVLYYFAAFGLREGGGMKQCLKRIAFSIIGASMPLWLGKTVFGYPTVIAATMAQTLFLIVGLVLVVVGAFPILTYNERSEIEPRLYISGGIVMVAVGVSLNLIRDEYEPLGVSTLVWVSALLAVNGGALYFSLRPVIKLFKARNPPPR